MPRAHPTNKRTSDVIRISSATVLAWLAFACSNPAFSAEEVAAPAEDLPQPQLQIAPFKLKPNIGGNLEYLQRSDKIGGVQSSYQTLTLALNAGADVNTFIWQPWFAQVNGGVGLNTYLTDSRYYSGPNASSHNPLTSTVFTGKVGLDVVPLSRYPFRTFYEKEDNRQNIGVASNNAVYKSTRFGMNQQYRTLSGQTTYGADYIQNFWEGAYFGEARQKRIGLDMRTIISANQDLSVVVARDFNEAPIISQSTLSNTLIGDHNYRPNASTTLHNMFNMGKVDIRQQQLLNEDNYVQLTSFGSSVSPERPLTITENVRLAGINNSSSIATKTSIRQTSASMGLGAIYQVNKEVQSYGNIGVNMSDDKLSGQQYKSSYETVGADYIAALANMGSYNYGRHTSGSFSNTTGDPSSTQTVGLSAGHTLNKYTTDSSQLRVTTDLDQTITANKATRTQTYLNLAHSGSLQWAFGSAEGTSALRVSASDTRAINGVQNFYQLFNLQLNRSQTMTRNSGLTGDVTIQTTRQGLAGKRTTYTTSMAGLNYNHQRVFGVPRLDFYSDLRLMGNGLPVTTGPQSPVSRSWTNHLGYMIGSLEMVGEAIVAQYNGINQSILLFRLRRVF
jgi:hypothetical protein